MLGVEFQGEPMGVRGRTGSMLVKKGLLMKACWDLSQGGNWDKAVHIPNQMLHNF